jgi:type II secretory pathway component PulF
MFNRVSFFEKLIFTKHLAVMVKSGIPLAEALGLLRDQSRSNFKSVINKICEEVSNGTSLHEAMSKFPGVFDQLYLSLVTVGEESGTLEVNLEYLATLLQKDYEFRKKVQSAMLYPALVVGMAVVLGGGIATFVLPQMANMFTSMDIELPLATKILMGFANFMKNWAFVAVPGAVGLVTVLTFAVRTPLVKPVWDKLLLSLPVMGVFIENAESGSFCRNLGLMIKSGFPIDRGLEIVAGGIENTVFRGYLSQIHTGVEKGQSIETVIGQGEFKYLPAVVSKMIGVGERTGKLDETLLYLGDFFTEEVDTMAKNLPTILEPILLTAIAGMVAFIAMAIISPIYQFTSSVHR